MPDFAFQFVPFPKERSVDKPRPSGFTSIYDYGVPTGSQKDMIQSAGHWVDFAKVVSASPRVLREETLREKIAVYEEAGICAYMGGQIHEFVFATMGLDGIKKLFEEARRVGFKALAE